MARLYEVLTSPSFPLVLCNFMRACGHVGILKTMGIYLEDMNTELGTTSTDLGVALGLFNAFCNFPSPLIAALYRHQSTRRLLLMCGACLPAIGVILTSMATSNIQVAVFLSISGLGNCIQMICYTLTLHRVARENYNLLFSISLTGFGVGMVLLPIVAEVLRQSYGWRGGLLIIGSLMTHAIPAAMSIRVGLDEECQSGVTTVTQPANAGLIADHFSSYDASFELLAGFDIIVLFLTVIVICKPKPNST